MSSPDSSAAAENSPAEAPTVPAGSGPGRPTPARLWLWALTAGIAAGCLAGLAGEAAHSRFQPVIIYPPNWDKVSPFDKPDIVSNLIRKETPVVEAKNTGLAYGVLGAAMGGALGLAGGLARRSARAALSAAFVGIVAGAAAGACLAAVLTPVFFRTLDPESGMMLGILTHAGLWVPLGAAAGLAFGIGLGGPRSIALALIGGLAGAALGTMAYELISALGLPNVRLDKPIPDDRRARLLAVFCVSVFTSLGAAVGVAEPRQKPKARAAHPLA